MWLSDHQPHRKGNGLSHVVSSHFPRTLWFEWALSTLNIEIKSLLSISSGYLFFSHLTESQYKNHRPGAFLSWPWQLRMTEGCFCPLRDSHGVSFNPSASPSAQHCGILAWSVVSPALEMLQGRYSFLLQRVTELQRHSEHPRV
jgi:hypothetical protein